MYFSLITPTPGQERDAAHDWARNAYEEHQWLWRFLPAPPFLSALNRRDRRPIGRTKLNVQMTTIAVGLRS